LLPKDTGSDDKSADIKKPEELMRDLITKFADEINLKSLIFNIDEIKDKIESKEPY